MVINFLNYEKFILNFPNFWQKKGPKFPSIWRDLLGGLLTRSIMLHILYFIATLSVTLYGGGFKVRRTPV